MSNLRVFCFFNLPDLEYHPLGYSAAWLKLPDFVPNYHLKSCSFSNAVCWRNARLIVTKIYRKKYNKTKMKVFFIIFSLYRVRGPSVRPAFVSNDSKLTCINSGNRSLAIFLLLSYAGGSPNEPNRVESRRE